MMKKPGANITINGSQLVTMLMFNLMNKKKVNRAVVSQIVVLIHL